MIAIGAATSASANFCFVEHSDRQTLFLEDNRCASYETWDEAHADGSCSGNVLALDPDHPGDLIVVGGLEGMSMTLFGSDRATRRIDVERGIRVELDAEWQAKTVAVWCWRY